MNNAVFGKTLENFVGYRNEKRLKSTSWLTQKLVCLGLSVLELSKMLMHEFWYDY